MAKTVENNASDSIGGILYQFYVGLQKCFELNENETILIEKDGDVSNATTQFEVKNFQDPLTDSHVNFWKTLNNWLKPGFDHTKYKSLVLLTTQNYGKESLFKGWNESTVDEKQAILNTIKNSAQKRYQTTLDKLEPGDSQKAPPAVLKIMESVLGDDNIVKIREVIAKFSIADRSECPHDFYDGIKNRYLRLIPTKNKDTVMQALLGFLISPEIVENHWEISNEIFSSAFSDTCSPYVSMTKIFPKKFLNRNISDEQANEYYNLPFVEKIKEIGYDEVIQDAMTHYMFTVNTMVEELGSRTANIDIYESYNQEIIGLISPRYRTACRAASEQNLLNASKDHYDAVMGMPSPTFGAYSDTHIFFKNGTIHLLANDEIYNLSWKLKLGI